MHASLVVVRMTNFHEFCLEGRAGNIWQHSNSFSLYMFEFLHASVSDILCDLSHKCISACVQLVHVGLALIANIQQVCKHCNTLSTTLYVSSYFAT